MHNEMAARGGRYLFRADALQVAFALLLLPLAVACATAPPAPTVAPYEPKFTYTVPHGNDKIDVTVGIVAPQFSGDGVGYFKQGKDGEVVKGLLRGLRTGFTELLVAKGFNTSGPFESLDSMTFPEKRGADFILYPDFDIDGGAKITNVRNEVETNILLGDTARTVCDVTVFGKGSVSLIVQEPLSKEKMWVKRLDVDLPHRMFLGTGPQVCSGQAFTQEIANAWSREHEEIFTSVMDSLNKYVSAEEFVMLKKQSAELRAKKTY